MVSDNAVEEIKQRLDIVEHISEYVQLKRAGSNYKGVCPFHDEKTPSFMVSSEKQIFHCFGCGAGGDAIGFTMRYEGMSFPEALEHLAKKTGVELRQSAGSSGRKTLRDALKNIQSDAIKFFKENLLKNQAARKYIKDRGITEESIEKFSLGFAPPGWHGLDEYLRKKGHKQDVITQSGLVATGRKGPYDIFRARIMFPIFDLHGEPIAFGGRVMSKEDEPKYLNSPDTELFHKGDNLYALNMAKEGIRKDTYSIVVEGYMDAIMCHQHGITSAVAPLGTALTTGHTKKLRRYSERSVLIFDGDKAGLAAARRSLDLMVADSMLARVLVLPEGEDPDSILNSKGPEHLRELIKKALTPVAFVLGHTEQEHSVRECAELIAKAADPLMRDKMILELADLSRISEGAIREKLRTLGVKSYAPSSSRSAPSPRPGSPVRRDPKLKAYNEEQLLLSAALASPGIASSIMERINPADIGDPTVAGMLVKIAQSGGGGDVFALAESDEERELVTKLMVSPGFDPEDIEKNVEDCLTRINRRGLDREIEEARISGDMKLLQDLITRRQNLLRAR